MRTKVYCLDSSESLFASAYYINSLASEKVALGTLPRNLSPILIREMTSLISRQLSLLTSILSKILSTASFTRSSVTLMSQISNMRQQKQLQKSLEIVYSELTFISELWLEQKRINEIIKHNQARLDSSILQNDLKSRCKQHIFTILKMERGDTEAANIWKTNEATHSRSNKSELEVQKSQPCFKSFQKHEVIIENMKLSSQMKCFEWRAKTEFPIAKILFYKVLLKKLTNECSLVEAAFENYLCSFEVLPCMPLSDVIYLTKQSMIGFERLYDRFGGFEINGKMILINKVGKCKVWFNGDITKNTPEKSMNLSKRQFKDQIVTIIQQKAIKNSLTQHFFRGLMLQSSLSESMTFINSYCSNHVLHSPQKLSFLLQNLRARGLQQKNKYLSKSVPKIPSFIARLRMDQNQQNQQKSLESPRFKMDHSESLIGSPKNQKKGNWVNQWTSSEKWLNSEDSQLLGPKHETSIQNKSTSDKSKRMLKKASSLNSESLFKRISSTNSSNFTSSKQIEESKNFWINSKQFGKEATHKFRKMSAQEAPLIGISNKNGSSCKQPLKFRKHSQNTVKLQTTLKKQEPIMEEIQASPQYNILIRYAQRNNREQDILQKNGWLKRIKSLTGQKFRDTVYSISDGKEILADHLLRGSFGMQFLDKMGTQTKGSIILGID